jgi:hypothetical protein
MELFEVHTVDVNGNSTRERDIRVAVNKLLFDDNIDRLRLNIEGTVIVIEDGSLDTEDRSNLTLTTLVRISSF